MFNNKVIILGILFIFLIGIVSALEFDNVKQFNKEEGKYGSATIKNAFGLGADLMKVTLVENTDVCDTDCYAIIKIDNYNSVQLSNRYSSTFNLEFEDLRGDLRSLEHEYEIAFTNKTETKQRQVCQEIELQNKSVSQECSTENYEASVPDFQSWDYKNKELPVGTFYLKLNGKKVSGERIDWIPTFLGKEISEWAIWDNLRASWNFEQGNVFQSDNGLYNFTTINNQFVSVTPNGKFDNGLYVNITTDGFAMSHITNNNSLKTGIDGTWTFFINITDNSGVGENRIFMMDASGTNQDFVISSNSSTIYVNFQGGGSEFLYAPVPELGKWEMITTTWNSSSWRLYTNTTLVSERTDVDVNLSGINPFILGDPDSANFNFTIDEINIFNETISEAQLESCYEFGCSNTVSTSQVIINSPNNITYSVSPTELNYTIQEITATDCWYSLNSGIINISITCGNNVSGLSGSSGSNTWKVSVNDSTNTIINKSVSFTIDSTPPVFNISTPVNNTIFITNSLPINISIYSNATDPNLESCWIHSNENATNQTFTCNNPINMQFLTSGLKIVTGYANDSLGGLSRDRINFTIAYYNYTTFENVDPISEGGIGIFNLTINMTNLPSTTALFIYNNTGYTPTSQLTTQNSTTFGIALTIPIGFGSSSGIVQSYNWSFNISGIANISTGLETQTVYSPSLNNCSTGGTLILNFTHRNEETKEIFNATLGNNLQIDLILSSLNGDVEFDYSSTVIDNSELIVCVADESLNNTSYRLDLTGSYIGTDLAQEFFYIDNGTISLSSSPQNYNWYDLELADSTTFLFTFLDENGLRVPDTIVETLRYYIGEGEFIEVERSKQDNNGETHIHLVEEDVIYKFRITLENQQIFLSDQYNAKCLSSPCSITLSAEPETEPFPTVYNNLPEGSFLLTTNKTTRQVTLSFNLNQTETMNLTIITANNNEAEIIGQGTTTASSGQVVIDVPLQYGNTTYYAVVYKNAEFVATRVVDLSESAGDYFGSLGLFLGALAILCLALIGASHGEWVIVWTVLGLVTASILFLVDLEWYALMTFVAGAGIFLIRLTSRRRVA